MEIKEYFYRAFSDIRKDHDLPDDKTICKDILERAKKMKKNDNVRQVKFTEITPEYAEPKKSHKALNVFAGVAGTAAVLTGAVFGLNWLNEHGGLKGPDVQGAGAGYHEDVAEQLSADTTENNDILASFVYDEFTVNVTDYEFDGISLKVFYDVIFADDCTLSSGEKLASVLPMAIFTEENAAEGYGELISETDNTQSCIYRTTLKAYTEKLTVDFKPNEEGYAEFGGNPFTVYADHKKPETKEIDAVGKAVNGVVPMDETVELGDCSVHFTGYEFDSEVVTFYYDIIGTTRMDIRPMGINGAVFNGTAGTEDKENNMAKDCHGTVALYEPAETARISFGKDLTDLTDKSYTTDNEAFAVTVHFDPESVIKTSERRKIMVGDYEQATRTVVYDDAYITPTHITVRLNNFYKRSIDDIREIGARVIMQDGRVQETYRKSVITADDGSDIIWIVREFDEPIDITQIKDAVLITDDTRNGEASWYFFGETYEKTKIVADELKAAQSIENAALYTPADVWFEYSNTRAHIIGYTFDGMNGRICYEVYHDNPSDRLDRNHGCVCNPNVMTCDEAFCGGGTMYTDYEPEGIVVHDYSIYAYEFCDELTLPFYSKWGSDKDKEMSKGYTFTMKRNTDIPCKTGVIDKYAQCEWGDTIHFDTYVLTPRTLSVMTADSPYNDDYRSETGDAYMKKIGEMRPVITLKNGSVISFDVDDDIYLKPISGGGKSGRFWNYYQFRDYIDIDEIALITMDGIEIYNSEKNLVTTE